MGLTPGSGLVLNIHLSDVGPHAISLSHSGGVDASNIVRRQASHALQSYGHPQPFRPMPAPQLGLQGAEAGASGRCLDSRPLRPHG